MRSANRRVARDIVTGAAIVMTMMLTMNNTAAETTSAQANVCVGADGAYVPPTPFGVRGADRWGRGGFGDRRDGGHRSHAGVDFAVPPSFPVRAPTTGVVRRVGRVYADAVFTLVEIAAQNGCVTRLLYVDPTVRVGDEVMAGDIVGVSQDISARYPGITTHVHLDMRIEGTVIDPSTAFAAEALHVADARMPN